MEGTIGYEALFSPEEWDSMTGNREAVGHEVTISYPPGELEGNEDLYELDCDSCGHIGALDTLECAEATARLHEEFVAVLVANFEIPA